MSRWLPAPLVGLLMFTTLTVYTIIGCIPLYIAGIGTLLFRGKPKKVCKAIVRWVATTWIRANQVNQVFWHGPRYVYDLPEGLSPDKKYLAIANHQSYLDILVVQTALVEHTAMIKFFLKSELKVMPIFGQVALFLDMPFMKRYSRAHLEKYPEDRGKDFEQTQKSVAHYQHIPLTLLSFVEGTRFTPTKHAAVNSPYENLLPPKAGGVALALGAFDGQITSLLDITISYPKGTGSMWSYFCGKTEHIHIHVSEHPIPNNFQHKDYNEDKEYRTEIQAWLKGIWQAKDVRLSAFKDHYA